MRLLPLPRWLERLTGRERVAAIDHGAFVLLYVAAAVVHGAAMVVHWRRRRLRAADGGCVCTLDSPSSRGPS